MARHHGARAGAIVTRSLWLPASFFASHANHSEKWEKMNDSIHVIVRTIQPSDGPEASILWQRGLQQTVDAATTEEKRKSFREFFDNCVKEECSEGGAVGINGAGLIEFYCSNKDACMFVAMQIKGGGEDEAKLSSKVVGMVGVKRGMDSANFPVDSEDEREDYNTFSIWKMSVSEESRGKGVGKKLMSKAEEWARDQSSSAAGGVGAAAKGKRMRLYTANPIAAAFYTSEDVGFIVEKKTDHYGIYTKKLD